MSESVATYDNDTTAMPETKARPVVVHDHAPSTELTPMGMLDRAITSGASFETLKGLMDLQERFERNQGRKAFDKAVSAAKAEIPVIQKNRDGHNSKYADFAALARAVDPILGKHGLSYRFRTVQDDKINVTCILSHEAGHYEENSISGPPDNSGSKAAIQAIGSTLTYLQRYTLTQALGLAASDDDDGKAASAGEKVSDEQIATLRSLIVDVGADLPKLLAYLKVTQLEDLYAARFGAVVNIIESKRGTAKKEANK